MKTKKHTRRIISILLALVMVFSLSSMAMAAPQTLSSSTDESFTITVNPAYSEETYTAYKIFDVTYNDSGSYSYTIEGDSAWYSTVSSSGLFTLTLIEGSNTYVAIAKDGITEDEIAAAFTTVPAGAVPAASVQAEKVVDSETGETGSTTVTLNVNEPGYYFVTTSLGSVVSIDTTHPTATIADKNPIPTLEKKVENESHNGRLEDNGDQDEGTEDTAKVGDIIEFEIDITNAAHKSALCLHDYTQEGLTYHGSDYINIYLNTISPATLVNSSNYTIQDSDCEDGCDFEIVFNEDWLDALSDSDVIIITYEAVVNEEAVQVNLNDAFITYGANGHSVIAETETDVYGLALEKVDGEGNELEGATFTLAYSDGNLVTFVVDTDEDGTIYTVYDAIDDPSQEEETTTEIHVGKASIFGLDVGTYTLTETEAPDGYNKLTSAITITIAEDGTVSISGNTQGSLSDGTITVVNNEGAILPGTGGIGTTIFYIVGIIIVAGAVVLLVTRRRMNRAA